MMPVKKIEERGRVATDGKQRGKGSSSLRNQGKSMPQSQIAQKQSSKSVAPVALVEQGQKKEETVNVKPIVIQQKPKPADKAPAHMAKVDKLANQLPELSGDSATLFVALQNLSTADLNCVLAHLNVEIRRRGVMSIASHVQEDGSTKGLTVGQRVKIRSGNPKFLGQYGVVEKVARLRCYVRLNGRDRADYFFIADAEPVGGQVLQVTPEVVTETVTRLTSAPPPMPPSEPEVVEPVEASESGPEVTQEN